MSVPSSTDPPLEVRRPRRPTTPAAVDLARGGEQRCLKLCVSRAEIHGQHTVVRIGVCCVWQSYFIGGAALRRY